MNVVGKVFTVLILVMSLVFMTLSLMVYAVHPDWRGKVIGDLSKQWDVAKSEKTQLEKEKKQLEERLHDETDSYVKRLAALEHKKTELLGEREDNQKQLASNEKAITDLVAAIDSIHKSVKQLFADAANVRGETKTIIEERRKGFDQVIHITDNLMNAVTERLRLAKLGRELQSQLAKLMPPADTAALPNHN